MIYVTFLNVTDIETCPFPASDIELQSVTI